MAEITIRTLRSDEIECRVAQVGKNKNGGWCSILLYKDARVDMRILDEVYGNENWKRKHDLIGDRLYCTVSVWSEKHSDWIDKQDVGTESYTEKEKGQASDAFKRACFNVGIGRELYTAPKIFINLSDGEYWEKGNNTYATNIRLDVSAIEYNSKREIIFLVLVASDGTERYRYGKPHPTKSQIKSTAKRIASGEDLMSSLYEKFYVEEEQLAELNEQIEAFTPKQ